MLFRCHGQGSEHLNHARVGDSRGHSIPNSSRSMPQKSDEHYPQDSLSHQVAHCETAAHLNGVYFSRGTRQAKSTPRR